MWPAVRHRAQAQAASVRLRGQQLDQPQRLHLAEAPVGVGDDPRRALRSRIGQLAARHDLAVFDRLHVIRNPHHAVRVVALEVGIDQAGRDELGFFGDVPPALKELSGEGLQGGGGERRHGRFGFKVEGSRFKVRSSIQTCGISIVNAVFVRSFART